MAFSTGPLLLGMGLFTGLSPVANLTGSPPVTREPGRVAIVSTGRAGLAGVALWSGGPLSAAGPSEVASGSARGWVVDLAERPIAGAQLELQCESRRDCAIGESSRFVAYSEADGSFSVGLPAGRYSLAATAAGFEPLVVPGLEVAGGGDEVLGTLLLAPDRPLGIEVVDPDERPLADARVHIQLDGADADLHELITGGDGTVWVRGLPAATRLHVNVSRPGFLTRSLAEVDVESRRPLRIRLDPELVLAGVVVDAEGVPVVGATLVLTPGAGFGRSQSADREGRFRFADLAPGPVTIEATAAGLGTARALVKLGDEAAVPDLRLELEVGAAIAGRVLGESGNGVAAAEIEVYPLSISSARPGRFGPVLSGTRRQRTGADGRFVVAGLEAGQYRVVATHPDRLAADAEVELLEADRRELELLIAERPRPEEGPLLTGSLYDGVGTAVVDATVSLVGGDGSRREERSDADGGFELRAERPGYHRLEVSHPRYSRHVGRPFELLEDEHVFIELDAGGSVTGSVEGIDPARLGELEVLARGGGEVRPGQVGWDGRFRIPALVPGRWLVQGRLGRRTVSAVAVLEGVEDEAEVGLRFKPGATVRGIALRDGSPLAAGVRLYCPESIMTAVTATDGEGRFAFTEVPEEDCELRLRGTLSGARARRQIEVRGDLALRIELQTATLSGRVRVGGTAESLAHTRVALSRPGEGGGPLLVAATDGDGCFAFPRLDTGSWQVRVERPGWRALERQIELAADAAIELALTPQGGG